MESLSDNGLGSLSQSVRTEGLKSARTILYVVGVLTVIGNIIFLVIADSFVKKDFATEAQKLRSQGMILDETKLAELEGQAIRSVRLVNGAGIALGIVFLILGANVYNYPVVSTITGLVLYIGSNAVFGYMDPATLASGWIIKILIMVGLFKAVQTAVAYEREHNQTALAEPPLAIQ